MMKKIVRLLVTFGLVLAMFPVPVLAETELLTEDTVLLEEDSGIGEEVLQQNSSSLEEESDKTVKSVPLGMITAIEAPDRTEYSFEYKPALDSLLAELPQTLTVETGDKKQEIEAKWVCEEDYNKYPGLYPFIADLSGYELAEGLEAPRITVTFEKEKFDYPAGRISYSGVRKDVPFVSASAGMADAVAALPAKYNLFEQGKLPKVRDQGQTGTCWAHATIGALETDLIHDGKSSTDVDLSEMHLAYFFYNAYDDPKGCRKDTISKTGKTSYLDMGGFEENGSRFLSNLVGAVSEKDAKLSDNPNSYKPGPSDIISKDKAQVRNVYYLNCRDINSIKKAVYEHGGVAFGYYACGENEDFYRATDNSYYCYKDTKPNHSVMIVGWDDSFSKDKFVRPPEGDGAWLIRNSWGQNGYGEAGYFWMSYYDKSMGADGMAAVAVDADTAVYKNCYAYDGCAERDEGSLSVSSNDTVAVTYDVDGREAVKAVAVEVVSADVQITATAKNMSTKKSVKGSVRTSNAGIYTIVFDKPLQVPGKATVKVTLKCKADSGSVKLAREIKGTYSDGDVKYKNYVDRGYDLNGKHKKDHDLRIKLYTDKGSGKKIKVKSVKLNKSKANVNVGATITLKPVITPKDATNQEVTWKSSNKKVATVSSDGVVKGKKKGTATITVKTKDGGKKASCKVTVKKGKTVKVKSVSLNKSDEELYVGESLPLKATVKPNNATNKKVTWKSSNTKVATVSSTGKVTAKGEGDAVITVRTKDGGKTAKCYIEVDEEDPWDPDDP
ncbi:MAG: Ig-like domain-containing protein, partial [Lachnospiraceae bacterium]|nr:Ig-like domain-containing protein [Lachnospiraceae bacterium]